MRFKLGRCMIYYIIIKLFFNIKLIKNKKLFQLMKQKNVEKLLSLQNN